MTTLKLSNKPADTRVAKKAPTRRADPAKRNRSQPFVKPENQNQKMDSILHGSDRQKNDSARQRNHRFDGKAHGEPYAQTVTQTSAGEKSETQRPLRSNLRAESTDEAKQAEFKKPDFNQLEPRQHKPSGIDTRITPRLDKNEPQYRQAPRRGGKARDGYDGAVTPQYGAAAKAAYKSSPVYVEQPRLSKVMAERGICVSDFSPALVCVTVCA